MNNRSLFEEFTETNAAETTFFPLLTAKDIVSLSRASRFLSEFYDTSRKLLQLGHYALRVPNAATLRQINKMIEAKPDLMRCKIPYAIDPAGREFRNQTLFQLALGAGNIPVCAAVKSALITCTGSEEKVIVELTQQRNAIVADGFDIETAINENWEHIGELLRPVVLAIGQERFEANDGERFVLSDQMHDVIECFRNALRETMLQTDTGRYYSNLLLLIAYDIYTQVAANWHYDFIKCHLFEDSILTAILSYLPANDAYLCKVGLSRYALYEQSLSEEVLQGDMSKPLQDIVMNDSINFTMKGRYYDIVAGQQADTTDAAWRDRMVTERLEKISLYIETREARLNALLQVSDPKPGLTPDI